MSDKKRILFVNEFSGLSTGFATYGHYVIPELYKTGKFILGEVGVYASKAHPKIGSVPWKVYPNEPDPNNIEEQKIYAQNKINQFGLWRFNEAALDFKPDFTISISDIWMNEWIHQTPYRNNFKHLQMVTCDGEPQKDEWLRSYKNNDVLLTYSYWAKNLIERVSNGRTKVRDVASPGTDINIFKPKDKQKLREQFGVKGDVFIIQTVMRNQPRKLFPELMKAFNAFLELCRANGRDDIAQKTYLHLHTTNPDMGWDLPKEIRNHGLGHKVIFTYMCDACKAFYPSFYQGDRTICRHCHQSSLRLPNTAIGLEREQLADIMAIPDLYVQYSVCLAKDQEICTEHGWKKIQDVVVGEKVLTHKNKYEKVTEKMINSITDRKMHRISVNSNIDAIECTDEHPVYAWTKKNVCPTSVRGLREYIGDCLREKQELPEPQWIDAKDLVVGDMVGYVIDETVKDIDKVDCSTYCNETHTVLDNNIHVKHGDLYPRFINVDEEFCKFLGMFAADGTTTSGRGIRVCMGIKELDNKKLAEDVIYKLSNKKAMVANYKNAQAIDICLSSTLHQTIFNDWCSSNSNKKLPDWVLTLPLNKQKAIICGLFMGDGYYGADLNRSVYATISRPLCYQVMQLLRRLKVNFNLHVDYKKGQKDNCNRQPQYRFEIRGDVTNNIFDTKRQSTNGVYIGNIHWMKVKSNEVIEYNDNVYNIEVENDNSYLTRLCVTHNCEGWGMAGNDAKSCGIPTAQVDYSGMSEQAHAPGGLPIPIAKFNQECITQTNQLRAIPDNEAAAQLFYKFFTATPEYRDKLGKEARDWVVKQYSWPNIAKIWENIIDETPILDRRQTWDAPPYIIKNLAMPNQQLSNSDFVKWALVDVLHKPRMFHDVGGRFAQILDQGFEPQQLEDGRMMHKPYNRENFVQFIVGQINQNNMLESMRCGLTQSASKVVKI
jgi:intein/homing endonuclease